MNIRFGNENHNRVPIKDPNHQLKRGDVIAFGPNPQAGEWPTKQTDIGKNYDPFTVGPRYIARRDKGSIMIPQYYAEVRGHNSNGDILAIPLVNVTKTAYRIQDCNHFTLINQQKPEPPQPSEN